jgi:Predicted O-methyltransferase
MNKSSIDLDQYILDHIDTEEDVLWELNRQTNLKVLRPRMVSGHLQGKLLKMICRMINPLKILEIGTFTGYSAISMATGLMREGASIDTFEVNDELQPFIEGFISKAGYRNVINLYLGSALDIVPTLNRSYDLIFIDGDKREYPAYFHLAMKYLNEGGYILADNILWDGKVVDDVPPGDLYTRGILEFNRLVKDDNRLEKVILPIRDGLFLIRKK